MPLQRGKVLGYDFNRMVVDFTMFNQGKTVRCAISTAAMDDLEGKHDVKADQRVDQFVRLRDAIEERACLLTRCAAILPRDAKSRGLCDCGLPQSEHSATQFCSPPSYRSR